MDFGPQQIGKLLIAAGIAIALLGILVMVLGRFGLFKLPGDLHFGSKNWRIDFSDSKLHNNLDCPNTRPLAYQLFPSLKFGLFVMP